MSVAQKPEPWAFASPSLWLLRRPRESVHGRQLHTRLLLPEGFPRPRALVGAGEGHPPRPRPSPPSIAWSAMSPALGPRRAAQRSAAQSGCVGWRGALWHRGHPARPLTRGLSVACGGLAQDENQQAKGWCRGERTPGPRRTGERLAPCPCREHDSGTRVLGTAPHPTRSAGPPETRGPHSPSSRAASFRPAALTAHPRPTSKYF